MISFCLGIGSGFNLELGAQVYAIPADQENSLPMCCSARKDQLTQDLLAGMWARHQMP